MKSEKRIYRIGISGSYGGLNIGDEAILHGIIAQIRRSLAAEITVFSREPLDTVGRHLVEKALPVRSMARTEVIPEIKDLDLFILGGGGILFDGEVKYYMREVEIANDLGVPVFVYAVGAGPLKDAASQVLVRDGLEKAAAITVREKSARRVLEEAGLDREIIVTADPAMLLAPEPLDKEVLDREGLTKRNLIGFSVREPGPAAPDLKEVDYHSILANTADYMIDRFDANIVFIPMERRILDMQHSHAVIAKMYRPQRATVLKEKYSACQLLGMMKQFVFAVGMRLHFLIFAAMNEVPFVALPYASKVFGFLEEFEMESPPLLLVNTGRLIAHIDKSWDRRGALKGKIRKKLPSLRKRAAENHSILLRILQQ